MKADELLALQRIGQLRPGQDVVLALPTSTIGGQVSHLVYGDDPAPLGVVLTSTVPDSPEDVHNIFVGRSDIHAVEWARIDEDTDEPEE